MKIDIPLFKQGLDLIVPLLFYLEKIYSRVDNVVISTRPWRIVGLDIYTCLLMMLYYHRLLYCHLGLGCWSLKFVLRSLPSKYWITSTICLRHPWRQFSTSSYGWVTILFTIIICQETRFLNHLPRCDRHLRWFWHRALMKALCSMTLGSLVSKRCGSHLILTLSVVTLNCCLRLFAIYMMHIWTLVRRSMHFSHWRSANNRWLSD